MQCPNCKRENSTQKEMCALCGYPLKPIPVPQGGIIYFAGYDWFILEQQDDKMLILSEKVIKKRPYHWEEVEITWENCDMRHYLNGEFISSLPESDRKRIIEVENENTDNPWYGTSGGNTTRDRVFLLSIDEVIRYFGDSGQKKNRPQNPGFTWLKDEYLFYLSDQYNINRRAVDNTGVVVHWWLRSPGANKRIAAIVYGKDKNDEFDHGDISVCGAGGAWIDGHMVFDEGSGGLTCEHGVRPALWINNRIT